MSDKYKFTDADKAFISKAEQYCAANEQCRSAVKEKLLAWGADRILAGHIVDYLVDNDFINEARYCRLYCDSKLRLQKWGRIKINYMLRGKQIDNKTITSALQGLDAGLYRETLVQLAESKLRTIDEDNPLKRKAKLTSYLASHGFESDEIQEALKQFEPGGSQD